MTFSAEWEQRYVEGTHLSTWPWSDVVSLVHRYCKGAVSGKGSVFELGCGAGANIPFFLRLGMHYFAIEGSETIVQHLHQRYPDLVDNILVGDFTRDRPFNLKFDMVLDRASLTHNSTASIRMALDLAFASLKPGGVFIGSDWFSTNHSDYSCGEQSEDGFTRVAYRHGQFVGTGSVHFSSEAHLRELFTPFELVYLEEKQVRRREPPDDYLFASWNIVARKVR